MQINTENYFIQILDNFYKNNKIKFYYLFFFSLIAGFFEYFGLALITLLVYILTDGDLSQKFPYLVKYFNLINFSDAKVILTLGLTVVAIYIFKDIYMLFFTWHNVSILQDLATKINFKFIKNFLFQDFLFINKLDKSQKIAIFGKINVVVWQYCEKYITLFVNSVIALMLVLYLFIRYSALAFVIFISLGLMSFFLYKYLKRNSLVQSKFLSNVIEQTGRMFFDIINSIKEIKILNKENEYFNKIKKVYKKMFNLQKQQSFNSVIHIYCTEIVVMIAFGLIFLILYKNSSINNQMILSLIITVAVVILRIAPLINRIQTSIYIINSNKKIAKEVLDFDLMFPQELPILKENHKKYEFKKDLVLNNISFEYDKNKKIENINLKINKGEFIGIVGKSGTYKSTLSLLISLLITPKTGKILIDGKNIDYKNNELKCSWRENFAIIAQDFSFLEDKIKDNFKFLNENSFKYLEKMNLDFDLNKNINELSFGQKQQLSLLRALELQKEILILDEATSSSDVIKENQISNLLLELKGQKTIIAIAHRFQILKNCDKIIYMGNSGIIDIGTFEILSNKYEEFKEMVELSNFKI